MALNIQRIDWNSLYSRLSSGHSRWEQGEHVSIIGTTGSGKTYLGLKLLPIRQYSVVFAVKREDSTLSSKLRKDGYLRSKAWEPTQWHDKYVIWPKYDSPDDEVRQYLVFRHAMREMFLAGHWTLFIDELNYFAGKDSNLGLDKYCRMFWQQGRSLGLSFVTATQRPYNVPKLMYDQPTHLFFFKYTDEYDLKQIGGIGWLSRHIIRETVSTLPRHHFLYIYVPNGEMFISKAE